jgi:transposase-like protein
MADDRMTLMELVEKSADEDLVRDMLAYAAERLMEVEVEAASGAPRGARTPSRTTRATMNTAKEAGVSGSGKAPVVRFPAESAGRIDLAISKLRKGRCFPGFLEPRRRAPSCRRFSPSSRSTRWST